MLRRCYQRLLLVGKPTKEALTAAARKLLTILDTLVMNGTRRQSVAEAI